MNRKTRLVIAVVAMAASAALAFADGAGGLLFGMVKPEFNPSFMPEPQMPLDLEYIGGYGYGVSREGNIVGGFGLAFLDGGLLSGQDGDIDHIAGGVGGMVLGWRLGSERFLHVDVATRLGLGGAGVESGLMQYGYAIAYAEPYAEVGIGLTPWMHLSATLGYQILGNFVPGKPFADLFMRSPTMGMTITWGSF